MTAYATIETAVDAIKQGAFDYLPKPFTADQLQAVIQHVSPEAGHSGGATLERGGGRAPR